MRDFDYSPAAEFLALFYEGTEHIVEFRALSNDRSQMPKIRFTTDPDILTDFCARYDGGDRGVYFAVAKRLRGSHSGARPDLAELTALWVDVDCYKIDIAKEAAVAALKSCPMPPSIMVDSGGGVHAYWLLREPLDCRLPTDGPDTVKEEVDQVLKQLAGAFAGDLSVCDITRVMRLPGTHNTKTGEMRRVHVLETSESRYELSDIQDMLDYLRPLIIVPTPADTASPIPPSDPFSAYAQNAGISVPIDVEQRLAAMAYMADGDAGIHQTQLHVSASMVAHGEEDDKIVDLLLNATKRAVGIAGANWNWKREGSNIRRMITTAREKFARADADRPKPRAVEQAEPAVAVGGGTVVDLAEQRKARKERKSAGEDDKQPLIARAGDAVIAWWRDNRGQVAVIDGQPYTYRNGIWTIWDKGDLHALKVAIQGILASARIDPKTQLLNAIARYVIEHPDLMREGVEWDNSRYVVCLDGAIDPLTREFVAHSPDHWATAGAEISIADMQQGCPQWLTFLETSFSDLTIAERAAVLAVLQEWFGAAMVRNKPRELRKALWLYGESRTGKTRISEVLRLLIGEPTCSVKLRALERNFGGSALIGRRAWIADDAIGSADEVDDALFKVIVTGEPFETDVKNAPHEKMRLNIPVMFTSNPLPRVKDQSDAVFNRAMLIHMRVVRSEEETAGLRSIDEIVAEQELAGVFSWALDGWKRLQARGRFIPPQSMLEAAAEFKSANNPVIAWAKHALVAAPEWMVDRRDLYASFKGWYIAEYGETAKVPSQKFVIGGLRQCMTVGADEPKRQGYPQMTEIKMTEDGLTYRRESARDLATNPGSGCPDSEVNRPRPVAARAPPRPTGKEPRF